MATSAASSTASSTTLPESPRLEAAKRTVKYWDRKGLLELWSGTIGARTLEHEQESHRKNREAEESHFRKEAWDWDESKDTHDQDDEGDMAHGNTYLGEFTSAPPIVYPPKDNSSLMMVLASAILAGGLMASAYLFSQNGQEPSDTDTNTTYKVEKWTPGEDVTP